MTDNGIHDEPLPLLDESDPHIRPADHGDLQEVRDAVCVKLSELGRIDGMLGDRAATLSRFEAEAALEVLREVRNLIACYREQIQDIDDLMMDDTVVTVGRVDDVSRAP